MPPQGSELDWLRERVRELEAVVAASTATPDTAAVADAVRRQLLAANEEYYKTTVFNMGTEVSMTVVSTVMLVIIFLTVAIEKVVHLSHHLPEAYHPVVQKIEEEFMIMGAVSFVLLIVEFTAGIPNALLLNVEFAHLLLFFAAISLVLFALRTLISTNACQKHWDRIERSDRDKAVEAFDCQSKESFHLAHMIERFLWSTLWPFGESDAKDSAEHLIMRRVFCDKFDLRGEPGDDRVSACPLPTLHERASHVFFVFSSRRARAHSQPAATLPAVTPRMRPTCLHARRRPLTFPTTCASPKWTLSRRSSRSTCCTGPSSRPASAPCWG